MKKLCLVLVLLLSGCTRVISPNINNNYNYEKIEKIELLDEFDKINADSEFSDIIFKTGKTFEIKTEFYGSKWKPVFSVKDGTLHVDVIDTMPRANNWNANKSNKIVITYPEQTQFSDIVINSEFGDFKATDLNANKIDLNLEYTDYEIKKSSWEEYVLNFSFADGSMNDIKLNNGTLTMDYSSLDADTLLSEKMDCSNNFSTFTSKNIQIKEFTYTAEYSDLDMNKASSEEFIYQNQFGSLNYKGEVLKECNVESSYGDVDFILKQAESDFNFDLHADMADLYLNDSHSDKHIRVGNGSISFDLEIEFATATINTN